MTEPQCAEEPSLRRVKNARENDLEDDQEIAAGPPPFKTRIAFPREAKFGAVWCSRLYLQFYRSIQCLNNKLPAEQHDVQIYRLNAMDIPTNERPVMVTGKRKVNVQVAIGSAVSAKAAAPRVYQLSGADDASWNIDAHLPTGNFYGSAMRFCGLRNGKREVKYVIAAGNGIVSGPITAL